jgi:molybdopterin converting factor subunit 1
MISVHVRYFASLKDHAGRAEEIVATECNSVGELYAALQQRHGFQLEPSRLRIAINDKFQPLSAPLTAGDEVLFLPPVAGG